MTVSGSVDLGPRPGYWWSPDWGLSIGTEVVHGLEIARPGEADLTAIWDRLRAAGRMLRELPVSEIAEALGRAGERILEETSALSPLVAVEAGFSQAMATRVLQGMAEGWTRPALQRLLEAEFENPDVLDGFAPLRGRWLHARGVGPTFHLGAGSVPGVTATSLIRSLLVKAPSLAKPGAGDVTLTVAFLRVLWEEAPAVASGSAVLYWEGGARDNHPLEAVALGEATQVVAYGGLEALERVRTSVSPGTRVLNHGPRTGLVVASAETDPGGVAEAAALFDQRGCVSPHVALFLGPREAALTWGRVLEDELQSLEKSLPRGPLTAEVSGRLHQLRGVLDLRAAAGEAVDPLGAHVWVAGLEDVEPVGARVVWIVPCEDEGAVETALRRLGPVLQSVGIDGEALRERLAEVAAAAGATRIVPIRNLAFPPPEWIHDGRGPLRELVRWAERD